MADHFPLGLLFGPSFSQVAFWPPLFNRHPWMEARVRTPPGSPGPREGGGLCSEGSGSSALTPLRFSRTVPAFSLFLSDFDLSLFSVTAVISLILHLLVLKFDRILIPRIVYLEYMTYS